MEPVGIAAKRSFTVRPHLPPALSALRELAQNLRWSYDRDTQRLFAQVNPHGWSTGIRDPARLLAEADKSHLDHLGTDTAYLKALASAAGSLRATLETTAEAPEDDTSHRRPASAGRDTGNRLGFGQLVAYFSPEFGVTEAINQYSGGLGVLAGDHLKAAGTSVCHWLQSASSTVTATSTRSSPSTAGRPSVSTTWIPTPCR
ncbi:MAG: DUF3417 domain-containing protein [Microthrixaceae bacterium]|nr:DUF3417 domain-containing protein [Microthrixaceae bacterium]